MANGKRMNGKSDVEPPLPPFVTRRPEVEDASSFLAWDAWDNIHSTGDLQQDYELGEHYADLAVQYGRATGNPAAITFTLSAIYLKQANGLIRAGEIERGFVDRISRLAMAGALN